MARQPQYLVEQQRTLGRYLAALREAAGLFQSDIARAVPCHRTTVTHAEAGSQLPDSYFWETADRVIGANGALIASYDELIRAKTAYAAEQQAKRRAQAHATARQLKSKISKTKKATALLESSAAKVNRETLVAGAEEGGSDDRKRRELVRLLSMIEAHIATSGAGDQLGLDGSARISNTLSRLDDTTVDEYTILNAHLWQVFMLSKSKGAIFPLVYSQLEALTASLGQSQALAVHQRLCALTSELLQLAGEVYFDANKYTDAACCYALAATASKEANSFDLWACALTRHAFIEIYERRFDKAASMLELAERLARKGDQSLSTRYWVAAVQAQAFAGLGELTASRQAFDIAERIHELAGDVGNGGWLRFDGSRLAEERGACYLTLRQYDLAETTLSDALQQNLSYRRRGSVLTGLAMIGAQRGDVDQLIAYADAALGIAEQTGSGFIGRKLQGLQSHFAPLLGNNRVCQLSERIMSLPENFKI